MIFYVFKTSTAFVNVKTYVFASLRASKLGHSYVCPYCLVESRIIWSTAILRTTDSVDSGGSDFVITPVQTAFDNILCTLSLKLVLFILSQVCFQRKQEEDRLVVFFSNSRQTSEGTCLYIRDPEYWLVVYVVEFTLQKGCRSAHCTCKCVSSSFCLYVLPSFFDSQNKNTLQYNFNSSR